MNAVPAPLHFPSGAIAHRSQGRMRILLVEDNEGDADLTRLAFEEKRMLVELRVVHDGMEALRLLFSSEGRIFKPDMILLDLNMPHMNGIELLEIVKRRRRTKHIPVLILTSSKVQSDIRDVYRCGANCYITKPADFDAFIALAAKIEDFWHSYASSKKPAV